MKANANAIAAHIRNGNLNGPIGAMAGLAIANKGAEGAQDIVDLADDFAALDQALADAGYASIQDYFDALDGVPGVETVGDVEQAKADLAADPENTDLQDALADALADAGYGSEDAYDEAVAGVPGVDPDPSLDTAIADLGGDSGMRDDISETRPSDEEVAEAEEALEAQDEAERAVLDQWNKNPDDTPEITPEEQELLDKLNERLEADAALLDEVIGDGEEDAI